MLVELLLGVVVFAVLGPALASLPPPVLVLATPETNAPVAAKLALSPVLFALGAPVVSAPETPVFS